ncbi:hypothetical protein IMSAGC018_01431 [Lachnospiraceae bacterium]|nr:hypothetical protein IMSAGC018_01431 [Lachnospiraceae bacterium]
MEEDFIVRKRLSWQRNGLALLAAHRTYCQNGSIAAGAISLQKLSEAMHLGKLGEQVVLKSRKAFSAIQYLGNEPAEAEVFYMKKIMREREARREYRRKRRESADVNELFILDIMREGMENGDTRLF